MKQDDYLVQERFSLNEACTLLDVSYSTALSLIKSKKIKAKMYGGRWFISAEELHRFQVDGNHPDSMEEE